MNDCLNRLAGLSTQLHYCVDSRSIHPGDCYVALKGQRRDGHDFLEASAAAGAKFAIVSETYAGHHFGMRLIAVCDPLTALQSLARHKLSTCRAKIIGVTGSVGKTTTKEFIKTLLEGKWKVAASPGNLNSQVGLPLTLLNHVEGDESWVVLEMGMTASGQIAQLVSIAPPDIAVLTNVSLVHAVNFRSLDEIAGAKAEIFSHPHTSVGIINKAIESFDYVKSAGGCRKISFSTDPDCHADVNESALPQNAFQLNPLLAYAHYRQNLLAAIVAARCAGCSDEEIRARIPLLKLPKNRFEWVRIKNVLFINDAYNASEYSVKAALKSLPRPVPGGKRIAVLSEMLELGAFSETCHRSVALEALKYVDEILCLGAECRFVVDEWRKRGKPVKLCSSRHEVADTLGLMLKPGDVVLLKGSNAYELGKVIDDLLGH